MSVSNEQLLQAVNDLRNDVKGIDTMLRGSGTDDNNPGLITRVDRLQRAEEQRSVTSKDRSGVIWGGVAGVVSGLGSHIAARVFGG
jgi:hypothetical protein